MSMHSEWKTAKKALDAAGIPTKKLFKRKDLVKELTNFEEAHKAVGKIPGTKPEKEAPARRKRTAAAREAFACVGFHAAALQWYQQELGGGILADAAEQHAAVQDVLDDTLYAIGNTLRDYQ